MSAYDDREYQNPPRQVKEGSGCGKIFLILLAIAGFGSLVLCCGIGGFIYWGYKQLNLTTEPAKVREIASSMLEVTIPDGYTPAMAMDMKQFNLGLAVFADEKENRAVLLLKHPPGGDFSKQEDSLKQAKGNRDFQVEKTEEKTFKLNGEDLKVTMQEGKDKDGKGMRQFIVDLNGKSGMVFLMLLGAEEKVTDEEFQKLLDSVKASADVPEAGGDVVAPPVEPGESEPAAEGEESKEEMPAEESESETPTNDESEEK